MRKDDILTALVDWNFWGSYQDESKERPKYLNKLNDLVETGEVVVVKGVRRSGKSTLLHQFLNKRIEEGLKVKNTLFVNFEDPRLSNSKLEDLTDIYETYKEEQQPDKDHIVVLDEVQEIEGWEKFVKLLHEAKKVRVLVTGSSSKLLSEEYSSLLSGRHVDMEVFPLSFQELLKFEGLTIKDKTELIEKRHQVKNKLREYLEWGGFPKINLVGEKERREILARYFKDILVKDVQERFNIRKTGRLEELAKYYLSNISNLQSYNKVKDAVNLSLDTVERFSSYLSTGRFLFFVPKFSFSHKKQLLNPKKVYSIDPGLRNVSGFRFSRDAGRLMENVVFLELFRRHEEIFYWKEEREVDFVVKDGNEIKKLIQVCYNLDKDETQARETKALIKASKSVGCEDLKVITYEEEGQKEIKGKKIDFVPLWKWLFKF